MLSLVCVCDACHKGGVVPECVPCVPMLWGHGLVFVCMGAMGAMGVLILLARIGENRVRGCLDMQACNGTMKAL